MEASLGGFFVHANVDLYEKMCEGVWDVWVL